VGVGKVGHEPESISLVRGADGRRWYTIPRCIVPERGQLVEHSSHASSKERWTVFQEEVAGSITAKAVEQSNALEEELGLGTVESGAFPGDGDVGAGKPGGDESELVRHSGESARKRGAADAGEEMDLPEPAEIVGFDVSDVALIYDAVGDTACRHALAEHFTAVRLALVVVGGRHVTGEGKVFLRTIKVLQSARNITDS
jgi:hypothetical protein